MPPTNRKRLTWWSTSQEIYFFPNCGIIKVRYIYIVDMPVAHSGNPSPKGDAQGTLLILTEGVTTVLILLYKCQMMKASPSTAQRQTTSTCK